MVDSDQDPVDPAKARAMELDAAARQAFEKGDYTRSRRLFEEALEVCRSVDWMEEMVYGLLHVTQAMSFEPDYDPAIARPMLEEALQIAQKIGTDRYISPVQVNRARVILDEGNYDAGLHLAQKYLQVAVKMPDRDLASSLLTFIAFAAAGLGQAENALRVFGSAEAERGRLGVEINEPFLTAIARRLAPARKALSQERQEVVEAEGYGLSLEEAVEFALSIGASDYIIKKENAPQRRGDHRVEEKKKKESVYSASLQGFKKQWSKLPAKIRKKLEKTLRCGEFALFKRHPG